MGNGEDGTVSGVGGRNEVTEGRHGKVKDKGCGEVAGGGRSG